MRATTKNTLSLKTTEGTEVIAVWPSCGEPVLAGMVDFNIGKTSTTRSVRTLFPENKLEKLFWGHGEPSFSLWQENRLSLESMDALRAWLKNREMPESFAPEPNHILEFIELAKNLPEPPKGFPTDLASLVKMLNEFAA